MIDPENITNYHLSPEGLEEMLLFWVFAAGKNARTASRSLSNLLKTLSREEITLSSPFDLLRAHRDALPELLRIHGVGCYNQKSQTIGELLDSGYDLSTCSLEELETIKGIGPKTARCYVLHSREGARVAGLDTHILKYLRSEGVEAPQSTPSSKKQYLHLEQEFLKRVPANMTVAEFDLFLWNSYARPGEIYKR